MPRHQAEVDSVTLADLEQALAQLRQVGAPDDAVVRLRVRTAFHQDGGPVRTVTARWDEKPNTTQP